MLGVVSSCTTPAIVVGIKLQLIEEVETEFNIDLSKLK